MSVTEEQVRAMRKKIGVREAVCVRVPQGYRPDGNYVPLLGYRCLGRKRHVS